MLPSVISPPAEARRAEVRVEPAGVLRAARWPIESVLPFAAPSLAVLARDNDAAFTAAYDDELERQRGLLAETAGTRRFRTALAIAAPEVARRWEACGGRPDVRRAKGRRLEATLSHYLMRAAGRATPHGLWAGVAPLTLVEDRQSCLSVRTRSGQAGSGQAGLPVLHVSLDLRPFEELLRHLARQPRYRREASLSVNPTLQRRPDGKWTWLHGLEREELDDGVVIDLVVRMFRSHGGLTARAFVEAISSGSPEWRDSLFEALDALVARDALRVDLALPPLARDAWEALRFVTPQLLEEDRPAWSDAVAAIEQRCRALESALAQEEAIEAEEVLAPLRALCNVYGLEADVDARLLHVDLRLPLDAQWSAAAMARATAAVRDLLEFHASLGLAELYRRCAVRALGCSARLQPGVDRLKPVATYAETPLLDVVEATAASLRRQLAHDGVLSPPTLAAIFERFELTDGERAQLAAPPDGAASVLPQSGTSLVSFAGDTVWLGLTRPQPGLFAGRFAALFHDADVEQSVASALAGPAADVLPARVLNPSAALRPPFCTSAIDAADRGTLPLRDLRVTLDEHARPLLAHGDALHRPFYNSAAAPAPDDACGHALVALSLANGWEFLSYGLPDRSRVVLDGGAVAAPARWLIAGEALRAIAGARGAERYRLWSRAIAGLHVPELVRARCAVQADELLVVTTSPLSVRCLFDTFAADAPWLLLAELPGDPATWPLTDEEGNHYVSELAIVWQAMNGDARDGE